MARLEPAFALMDVNPGDVLGIRGFRDSSSSSSSSSSLVVVTTNRRIFVWDISSRRLTRSFILSETGEFFTTPAFLSKDQDGALVLQSVVNGVLWIWLLDAADFRSEAIKVELPFAAVDAAPILSGVDAAPIPSGVDAAPIPSNVDAAPIPSGVALLSKDGRAGIVSGAEKHFSEIPLAAAEKIGGRRGGRGEEEPEAEAPALTWSRIVLGCSAQLHSSHLRVLDFVHQTVNQAAFPDETTVVQRDQKSRLETTPEFASSGASSTFVRRNSFCFVVGHQIIEVRMGGNGLLEELFRGSLEREVRVLWIHPNEDFFFCIVHHSSSSSSSSSSSLQICSLRLNTILASQSVDVLPTELRCRETCAVVGDSFCLLEGRRVSVFPFSSPAFASLLSSNLGKQTASSILDSQNCLSWQRSRKRVRDDAGFTTTPEAPALRRPKEDALTAFLKLASSSPQEEAAFVASLQPPNSAPEAGLSATFEALLDLLSATGIDAEKKETFWPEELFRYLLTRVVVRRWESVIDVILLHSSLACMELALHQPGIDAPSLCRLLRFCVALKNGDDDENDQKLGAKNMSKSDEIATACSSSPSISSLSPRRLLFQIVSTPVREESLRLALKTLPEAEIDDVLETLLAALKEEEEEEKEEKEEEEEKEADDEEEEETPSPSLPRAALFRWITLLIDAHFFRFVLDDDDRRAGLLRQAESQVEQVQAYFATRDGLDALMDRMRQRALILRGPGAPLKTTMAPEDDYCIQLIEI